jgi:hypothetical protein
MLPLPLPTMTAKEGDSSGDLPAYSNMNSTTRIRRTVRRPPPIYMFDSFQQVSGSAAGYEAD